MEIVFLPQKDEVHLFGDEKQLRRVVENILNNQIKYAYKNSKIEVCLNVAENKIVVSFENSSPKIDEQIQKTIFEKYKSYKISNLSL